MNEEQRLEELWALHHAYDALISEGKTEAEVKKIFKELEQAKLEEAAEKLKKDGFTEEEIKGLWHELNSFGDIEPDDAIDRDDSGYWKTRFFDFIKGV